MTLHFPRTLACDLSVRPPCCGPADVPVPVLGTSLDERPQELPGGGQVDDLDTVPHHKPESTDGRRENSGRGVRLTGVCISFGNSGVKREIIWLGRLAQIQNRPEIHTIRSIPSFRRRPESSGGGRFVAMISFLHTPVSLSAPQPGNIGVNWEELKLVNRIRQGTTDWQHAGYPGVTSTTRDLINHWTDREEFPLYFDQIDAVLTHIYLRETSPTDIPQDFQRINLKYTTA